MKQVWILFSVYNEYNQPDRAFEKLFWHEPTLKDLSPYGFDKKTIRNIYARQRIGNCDYWVEIFED